MDNVRSSVLQVPAAVRMAVMVGGIALGLNGCSMFSSSSSSAPKPALPNEITFEVANNANVDAKGRAVPIQVKVFILKSSDSFEASDFFSLQDKVQPTLGAEMVGNDQHVLQPGETYTMKLQGNTEARMVGIIAGYRDLNANRWRLTVPLPDEKKISWYKFWKSSPTKMEMRISIKKGGIEVLPTENP